MVKPLTDKEIANLKLGVWRVELARRFGVSMMDVRLDVLGGEFTVSRKQDAYHTEEFKIPVQNLYDTDISRDPEIERLNQQIDVISYERHRLKETYTPLKARLIELEAALAESNKMLDEWHGKGEFATESGITWDAIDERRNKNRQLLEKATKVLADSKGLGY